MRLFIVLLLTLTLTSCGWFDRYVVANVKGLSRVCVDGVEYLQFPSGVTPSYAADGKLKSCK